MVQRRLRSFPQALVEAGRSLKALPGLQVSFDIQRLFRAALGEATSGAMGASMLLLSTGSPAFLAWDQCWNTSRSNQYEALQLQWQLHSVCMV